jgi:hypothetical protein
MIYKNLAPDGSNVIYEFFLHLPFPILITWKTGLELHEDNEIIFSSPTSKFDNRYQVLTIVGDNSEEFDDNNNPVLNPANINRGANHLAEGDTVESLASREKIRLSVEEWNTIKAVIETVYLYQQMQTKTCF